MVSTFKILLFSLGVLFLSMNYMGVDVTDLSTLTGLIQSPINKKSVPEFTYESPLHKCFNDLPANFFSEEKTYFASGVLSSFIEKVLSARGWYRMIPHDMCPMDVDGMLKYVDLFFNSRLKVDVAKMNPNGLISTLGNQFQLTNKAFLAGHIKEYWIDNEGESFIPYTLVLHYEDQYQQFLKELSEGEKNSPNDIWIVKPRPSLTSHLVDSIQSFSDLYCEGADPSTITNLEYSMVQRYIFNPLLLNNRKAELKVFILVTAASPVIAYYHSGYLVPNIEDYDLNDITNDWSHMTQMLEQPRHENFNGRLDTWTFDDLEEYLQQNGLVSSPDYVKTVLEPILKNDIGIAIDSVADIINIPPFNQFALLTVDFILDENLKPWLLEISPSPLPINIEKLFWDNLVTEMIDILLELTEKRKNGEEIHTLEAAKNFQKIK